ncbi:chemotaxis protein CheW [Marinospirillum alkaliphilum]|uniref:Purine-binding chemotaxis protein CheW n=1 Tax=Marinospirillum alkaliphilum DSM 21637 TaxID=1122209 RepID=A0A1K1VDJ4_9GAMM|nr:chemotaxis protein CheW [Marinospirillum alkaliphilum]SFX22629.1 purine-binding chemotaxis protein CheW [Marinospirillum alkaliphilum DSM 21637]
MSWHDTPQQAIEDYLEALLHDDLLEEAPAPADVAPMSLQREESLQARQLSDSMERARQAARPAAPAMPLETVEPVPRVILPDLQMPAVEPEAVTEVVIPEPEVSAPEPIDVPEPIKVPEAIETPAVPEPVAPVVQDENKHPAQPPTPPGWKNGRPVWAQERFECLLFKVKGLTLAVPLVELGGIIKIEKEPTPLFGQPSWFIGMLRSNNMNVCMVDTAQWVLPPALIAKNPEPYKLIIRIHNSVWGLSCNEVDRSISLQPDQVRWRTSLGKRPWLAGTVIDHMCALIDVAAFDRLLREGHGELEPANLSVLKDMDE